MASGGDLAGAFKLFATKADHKEATTKDITRWMTDAGCIGKKCNSNNLDIAFAKCKTKGKPNLQFTEMSKLIDELAKAYKDDKKCSEDDAKQQLREKLAAAQPKAHGATKTSKTGGVSKMTDTSKYTGAHKERFDASGKGKGVEGREDRADTSGYVGNYKGEGTYDEKK